MLAASLLMSRVIPRNTGRALCTKQDELLQPSVEGAASGCSQSVPRSLLLHLQIIGLMTDIQYVKQQYIH